MNKRRQVRTWNQQERHRRLANQIPNKVPQPVKPIIPGQLGVSVVSQPGPNAHPIAATVQGQDGLKMLAFGGLTKLEHVAAMIVGNIDGEFEDPRQMADAALNLAEALLTEAHRRQQAAAEQNGQEAPEQPVSKLVT